MPSKIDLSDVFELFIKTEEKPVASPPASPEARKWRQVFATNAAAVLCARNIPRLEAERVAFANTVAAFLDANRPATDPSRCVQCGLSERPNDLRPMGGGDRHSWVHIDCWKAWSEHRRVRAIEALAAMGIVSP